MHQPFHRPRRALATLVAAGALAATALVGLGSPASAATGLTYVAFGDSYSAGPGLSPYRTSPIPGCQTSTRNWPSELVRLANGASSAWADYSCTGATTGAAHTPTATASQTKTLGDEIAFANTNQVLGTSTQYVTIMIGGNDTWVGKANDGIANVVLIQCLAPPSVTADCGTSQAASPSTWLQPADITALAYKNKLSAQITQIKTAAPHAKILLVGYPTIMSTGDVCTDTVNPTKLWDITANESRYADTLLASLNTAESGAAGQLGVTFVDLRPMSVGHGICGGANHWIEPNKIYTDWNYPFVHVDPGSAHPNPNGMTAFAGTVKTAL